VSERPLLDTIAELSEEEAETYLASLPLETLVGEANSLTSAWEQRRQENAILFYEPVQAQAAEFHGCTKREILISGGNRSAKSDTTLAELVIQATGVVPYSLKGTYPAQKLQRRPIRARVLCKSIKKLEEVIKPKLQYWRWNGPGVPGSDRGHWGWIPRQCLRGGEWSKAYSEKYNTLTLADGGCFHFNTYEQDVEEMAGGSFHVTFFDELPPEGHYKECRMRLLDTGGQLMTAMTPPTEASGVAASWVYDQLYQPGMTGHEDIAAFEFFTEHNRILGSEELRWIASGLTDEERQVRFYGKFLHLSGLIHPLFTGATTRQWCLTCDRPVTAMDGGRCPACLQGDLLPFTHVIAPFSWPSRWPVVMVIDPHPRKPCAITWTVVDEEDQWIQVGECEATGTAYEVKAAIEMYEERHDLQPVLRLIDPNAAESRNDKMEQGWTLRREFDKIGLRCTLANDNFTVGKDRFNEALRPDPLTQRPRWQIFDRCEKTISALSRFTWDEWTRNHEFKEPKQTPRDKHKDFPDTCRYLAMANPTYRGLQTGHEVLRYRGAA